MCYLLPVNINLFKDKIDVNVIDVILVFLLLTLNILTPSSNDSTADFEQVNFSWVVPFNALN